MRSRPALCLLVLGACLLLPTHRPLAADDTPDAAVAPVSPRFTRDELAPLLTAERGTVTMFEQEVGSMRSRTSIVTVDGEEQLLVEERSRMRLKVFGDVSETEEVSREWYSLVKPGHLLRGESIIVEDGVRTRITAERRADRVHCERTVSGESEEFTVEGLATLQTFIDLERWTMEDRAEGDTRSETSRRWTQDGPEFTVTMTVLEPGEKEVDGVPVPVRRFRVVEDGVPMEVSVTLDGKRSWMESDGGAYRVQLEESEWSEGLTVELPDIPETTLADIAPLWRIRCTTTLGDADRLEELVLVADRVRPEIFSETARQRVEILGEDRVRLHLRAGHRATEPTPLDPETRAQALESTRRFRLEDSDLRETAAAVVGAVREPLAMGALICDWIYYEMEYDAAKNSDRSDEIFSAMAGDCTEHAILFVALARAVDLPARAVTGIVWMDDEEFGAGFYRHAWAEFHDGQRWITVDPTWGQVGVDAGHIRLDEEFEESAGGELHAPDFAFELELLRRGPARE